MDFNMQFDDMNEDEDSEIPTPPLMGAFLIGPSGPIPIPFNLANNEKVNKVRPPICTIFNGKFAIFLVDEFSLDSNGIGKKILLECVLNTNYNGKDNDFTLFNAYEYLKTTHFLNFLISSIYHRSIWFSEGIEIQIQMMNSEIEKYAKILIIIETSRYPDYLIDYFTKDSYEIKSTSCINQIPGVPIMETLIKAKSLYAPVVYYDISLAINRNSKIDFGNMNLSSFYNTIIWKYIEDALNTFYPYGYNNEDMIAIGEKLLKISFNINRTDKLMNIRMLCIPAFFHSNTSGNTYNYYPTSADVHWVSSDPINRKDSISNREDFDDFLATACSSDVSQVISLFTINHGKVSHCGADYDVITSADIICTPKRVIVNRDRFRNRKDINNGGKRVFSKFAIKNSRCEAIINYWCALESIRLIGDLDPDHLFIIHGFINFDNAKLGDQSFDEIYPIIKDEMSEIFLFTQRDYRTGYFYPITCYTTKELTRVVLISKIDNSTNAADQKKRKKKLFWRKLK